MQPKRIKRNQSPESDIQKGIITYLTARHWFVREVHAGARHFGWPDLYCSHKHYGIRWIEVKLPDMKGSKFTKSQLKWFPQMIQGGSYIWILTAANDYNFNLLFNRPTGNFLDYL